MLHNTYFPPRREYTRILAKRGGYVRRHKIPSSHGTKTCPDMHIQSDINGPVIDEHSMNNRSSAPAAPADISPFFAHLPPELRLRIWHFASTIPRVVELQATYRDHGFRSGNTTSFDPTPSRPRYSSLGNPFRKPRPSP
jgi:2EXR family